MILAAIELLDIGDDVIHAKYDIRLLNLAVVITLIVLWLVTGIVWDLLLKLSDDVNSARFYDLKPVIYWICCLDGEGGARENGRPASYVSTEHIPG